MKKFIALTISECVFFLLINVKMPTLVGILTFMSRIKFVLISSGFTKFPRPFYHAIMLLTMFTEGKHI